MAEQTAPTLESALAKISAREPITQEEVILVKEHNKSVLSQLTEKQRNYVLMYWSVMSALVEIGIDEQTGALVAIQIVSNFKMSNVKTVEVDNETVLLGNIFINEETVKLNPALIAKLITEPTQQEIDEVNVQLNANSSEAAIERMINDEILEEQASQSEGKVIQMFGAPLPAENLTEPTSES